MLSTLEDIRNDLRCPCCRSELLWSNGVACCSSSSCSLSHRDAFPEISGQPALIDFNSSVIDRTELLGSRGSSRVNRPGALLRAIKRIENSTNVSAQRCSHYLLTNLQSGARVLVIGGGEIGSGASELYTSDKVKVVGFDIYASQHTQLLADAHNIPFADRTFDAVWIQAVLEHVLEPSRVVGEIQRVLRPSGIVFADTPFMQQVHEGAYDFTRFTLSGHRWLFRNFQFLEAGATSGAGTSLIWSIRYFTRAITGSNKLARLSTWPFLWLRLLDRIGPKHEDAASGVYFLGRNTGDPITPKDAIAFYNK